MELGIPYGTINPDSGAVTCPRCGEVIPETYDATGEAVSANYPDHYQLTHVNKPTDIEWILTEKVQVSKFNDVYTVISLEPGKRGKRCYLNMAGGRLHFNGEDIETEDFMAYVGLMDAVDEADGKPVTFED